MLFLYIYLSFQIEYDVSITQFTPIFKEVVINPNESTSIKLNFKRLQYYRIYANIAVEYNDNYYMIIGETDKTDFFELSKTKSTIIDRIKLLGPSSKEFIFIKHSSNNVIKTNITIGVISSTEDGFTSYFSNMPNDCLLVTSTDQINHDISINKEELRNFIYFNVGNFKMKAKINICYSELLIKRKITDVITVFYGNSTSSKEFYYINKTGKYEFDDFVGFELKLNKKSNFVFIDLRIESSNDNENNNFYKFIDNSYSNMQLIESNSSTKKCYSYKYLGLFLFILLIKAGIAGFFALINYMIYQNCENKIYELKSVNKCCDFLQPIFFYEYEENDQDGNAIKCLKKTREYACILFILLFASLFIDVFQFLLFIYNLLGMILYCVHNRKYKKIESNERIQQEKKENDSNDLSNILINEDN